MEIEDYCFSVSFSSRAEVEEDFESCLTAVEGELLYCREDDSVALELAGRLRLFYVDIEHAVGRGYDLAEVCDLDGAVFEFYGQLFDRRTRRLRQSVCALAGCEALFGNLLILDRLEILPAYRGRGVGLWCVERCVQQQARGCALVALKYFPLQFEHAGLWPREWQEKMRLEGYGRDRRASRAKLREYYARLGFRRVPGTEMMVLNPAWLYA